jgi:tetratricopeptide (TPR) repeat protein
MIALASVCLVTLSLSTPASAQLGLLQQNIDRLRPTPGNGTAWWDLASIADAGGGNCAREDARATIRECTRLINDRQAIYNAQNARLRRACWFALRANAHAELGDIERAEADYQRAITAYPNGPWIYISRAIAYENIGDYSLVLDSLYQGEAVDPDSPDFPIWIAFYRATAPDETLRDGAEAVAKAQRALGLAGNDQAIYVDTLAAAYAEAGDFDQAVEEQRRAIGLLPADDSASIAEYESRLNLYLQGVPARLASPSQS